MKITTGRARHAKRSIVCGCLSVWAACAAWATHYGSTCFQINDQSACSSVAQAPTTYTDGAGYGCLQTGGGLNLVNSVTTITNGSGDWIQSTTNCSVPYFCSLPGATNFSYTNVFFKISPTMYKSDDCIVGSPPSGT